ncbi:MAG: hypothetical protein MUP21_05230 [Dehalococcoidia bacterium]|nr:hypothetical protein [Dehalococcoidia bacterium]
MKTRAQLMDDCRATMLEIPKFTHQYTCKNPLALRSFLSFCTYFFTALSRVQLSTFLMLFAMKEPEDSAFTPFFNLVLVTAVLILFAAALPILLLTGIAYGRTKRLWSKSS